MWLERRLAPLLLVTGLAASALAAWQQQRANAEDAVAETRRLGTRVVERAAAQFDRAAITLGEARAFVLGAGPDAITRERFRTFSQTLDLARDAPGMNSVGLVRRVAPAEEAAFVAQVRAQGDPGFAVRRIAPHDGERRIVQWLEPAEANRGVTGLDLGSEPARRRAIEGALAAGGATITAPLDLVVGAQPDGSRSLLMFMRVPADGPRGRFGGAAGAPALVYARIELQELLLAADLRRDRLSMAVADITDPGAPVDFRVPVTDPRSLRPEATVTIDRPLMGRTWRFVVTPRQPLVDALRLRSPAQVAGFGVGATLLLSLLAHLVARLRQRTREALAERTRLVSMLDHAGDAFIGLDLQGRVMIWNRAAERLFGWPVAQTLGQPLTGLTLDANQQTDEDRLVRDALAGRATPPFETQRRHRDGSQVDVELSAGPMFDADGAVIGVVKVLRSVSERVEQRRQLRAWGERLEAEVAARTDELQTTAGDLRNVLDAMPSMVSSWDAGLHNRFANRAYASYFGRTPESIRGLALRDLLGDEWFARSWPYVSGALGGQAQVFERDVAMPDGSVRRSLVHFEPHHAGDQVIGFYALVHDISEVKRAQQRLADILDGTQAGTWEWNVPTGRVDVNDRWTAMLGYEPADLAGATLDRWQGLVHPDDVARMRQQLHRHCEGELPTFEVESRMRHKAGHWVWMLTRGRVVTRGAAGQPLGMAGILLDVTERKTAEEAMRHSERLLARTGRIARTGGWDYEVATGELRWTDETCRLHGVAPGHRPTLDEAVLHCAPDARPTLRALLDQALDHGEGWDVELPLLHADGRTRWVRMQCEVETAGTRVVRLAGAVQDVTAAREAQQALLRQQALMEALLQASPVAVCVAPLAGGAPRLVNERYCTLADRSRDEAMALDAARLYADPAVYGDTVRRLAAGETLVDRLVELRAPERPGRAGVWALATCTLIEHEGVPSVLSWLYDVSELRAAREAAQQAQQVLQAAMDAVDEGFVLYGPDDRMVLCNEKYRQIYAASAPAMVPGARFEDIVRYGAERGHYRQAIGRVDEWVQERMVAHRSGSSTLVQELTDGRVLRIAERRLPDGHVVGFRFDITEIERARQAAESASRAKSEFLAVTSHEIRTPLNAILGLAYLLERAELPAAQLQQVRQITRAGRSLLTLLNDVLDLSKIEAGQLQIEQHDFDLRAVVEDEVALLAGGVRPGGPEVRLELDPALPPSVRGDEMRLRQVLHNLLGNALKFTERGSVAVRLRAGSEAPLVELAVADTGIGIEAEARERLFTPFVQADTSTTRRFGGTGLGLSITAKLVALMGGRIALDSTPGVGSTFTVTLPLPAGEPPAGGDTRPAPDLGAPLDAGLPGQTLLVVDDSELNLDVARKVLELEGARVVTCEGGTEALQWLRRNPGLPDAVLLDLQMPGMDGFQVARELRTLPGCDTLPVIALSAGVLREDRDAAIGAGMNDFMPKPLEPDRLVAGLRRHIEAYRGQPLPTVPRRGARAAPVAAAGIAGLEAASVASALLEDRPLLLSMVRRLLAEFASVADDPVEALPARLHKLRGSAQVVGAGTLAHAADRLEALVRAGPPAAADLDAARRRLREQVEALTRAADEPLRAEAARLARLRDEESRRAAQAPAALDAHLLAELRELVDSQSVRAAERVEALAGPIAAALGPERLARLRGALEEFDFAGAADALQG